MLERPAADVFPERAVEPGRVAEDRVTQHEQADRGLAVRGGAEEEARHAVGGHDGGSLVAPPPRETSPVVDAPHPPAGGGVYEGAPDPGGLAPPRTGGRGKDGLEGVAFPAARVPEEGGRGTPGHVAPVFRRKAPGGRRPLSRRSGRRLSDFALGDDGHRRIGAQRSREPLAFGCRQLLERIREPPGPGDDKSPRDRDREIDVTVLEVELALAEVR